MDWGLKRPNEIMLKRREGFLKLFLLLEPSGLPEPYSRSSLLLYLFKKETSTLKKRGL